MTAINENHTEILQSAIAAGCRKQLRGVPEMSQRPYWTTIHNNIVIPRNPTVLIEHFALGNVSQ